MQDRQVLVGNRVAVEQDVVGPALAGISTDRLQVGRQPVQPHIRRINEPAVAGAPAADAGRGRVARRARPMCQVTGGRWNSPGSARSCPHLVLLGCRRELVGQPVAAVHPAHAFPLAEVDDLGAAAKGIQPWPAAGQRPHEAPQTL